MSRHLVLTTTACALLLPSISSAQTLEPLTTVPSEAVGVALDGPAIPTPRMTQADVTSGAFSLKQLRRRGLEMFTTPFNQQDGHGDGPTGPDPTAFGQRPTTNGTWLRLNGIDSQTCQECHAFLSTATIPPTLGIAGVAGIANTAFPGVTQFDLEDLDASMIAEVNGRLINPPFLLTIGGSTSATGTYSSGAIPVPAGIKAVLNVQALVLDPTAPFGGSLSNGLELHYK